KVNNEDFISLSDIARFRESEYPSDVIGDWMRTRNTIEFLGTWEQLYNPDFNSLIFEGVDKEAGRNGFVMTPKRWIETVNAIGMKSNMGRYAETLAHKDIAFKFASWLSTKFELYLIKEFQRLKEKEQTQLAWSAKRELAKINYHIQTDAIKEKLIVPTLTSQQRSFVYADEADLLNVALFGKTALQWRNENKDKDGNIRDYATIHQLLVLANMESYNAIMIKDNISQEERIDRLNETARQQLQVLEQVENKLYLPKLDKK
ncbi:MAG: KilA-N domain-containing protein, partial [Clostridiales bacterium]|nr:KilA-N domain-containing protein [Clostridiales bacterium]